MTTVLWSYSVRYCRLKLSKSHKTAFKLNHKTKRIMKTSFKKALGLFKHSTTLLLANILFFSSLYCSKNNMSCEENNTGTLIVTNSRSKGTLKVFFNREPRSGNTSGDLNIQPGESASTDLLSGQISLFALLDLSSCGPEGTTCIIRNETLEGKTVDLSACQDLNVTY